MHRLILCVLLAGFAALPAQAHGPTPHKIDQKIAIAAAPKDVWAILKDFSGISKWSPMIEKSSGTENDTKDGERHVILKGGGELVDGLDEYDAAGMTYSYRLRQENVEAFPVSYYTAKITVRPASDTGSEVEWSAAFYRGDTGNYPPENLDDEAAEKAMAEFFKAGLAGLKAKAEAATRS